MFGSLQKKVQQAFSNAAFQYDFLTPLHKDIGRDLLKKLHDVESAEFILDVGMGTGWLTERLKSYYSASRIVGIDFAPGMIAQARREEHDFSIVQGDALKLPFKERSFDVIVSNLAYQWVDDLPRAFQLLYSRLQDDGHLVMSVFGHETFRELFDVLRQARGEEDLAVKRLATKEQIGEALHQAGFRDVVMDYEHIQIRFENMMELIRWIKNIGANGLKRDFYVGKKLLARASEIYDQQYRDYLSIVANLEVVWLQARR
jgi:malonyl-CoA O-methyltransferase